MNEVLQTNIFFYITSVSVVIVTVLLCVGLYYIIGILENVRDVTNRIRRGSEVLEEDIQELRENIVESTAPMREMATFVARRAGWMSGEKKRPKRTARRKKSEAGNTADSE